MRRPAGHRVFLAVAAVIRALPRLRGKVRLGLAAYRLLNRGKREFVVDAPLFRERLPFRLHLTSAHERMALLMNAYEPETIALLAALWDGGTALDVGANIGLVAIPLAMRLRARGGRVIALEAMRSNFAALVENVALNHAEEVLTPLAIAAGAFAHDVMIQIEGDEPARTGTANILPDSFSDHVRVPLHVEPIDALCAAGTLPDDISVIKIDTDGYDLEVLRGARDLLQRRRPAVVAEINPVCLAWHSQSIDDVVAFAREIAYEVWVPDAWAATSFHRRAEGEVNLGDSLLLPSERAAALIARLPR